MQIFQVQVEQFDLWLIPHLSTDSGMQVIMNHTLDGQLVISLISVAEDNLI